MMATGSDHSDAGLSDEDTSNLGIIPYIFEPLVTDDNTDVDSGSESDPSDDGEERMSNTTW